MKMKSIFNCFVAMAVLSLWGCSLDEDTTSLSTPDNYFRKYSECQLVANSLYPQISTICNYTYATAMEFTTDIGGVGASAVDGGLRMTPANPGHGSTMWTQGYRGVQRCNFAIAGYEESYENGCISEDQYNQLMCEAKSMRALYYYILTCAFGNVPFYFDDVSDNETLERIRVLPRMDANETRQSLIDDLWSIAPYVDQTRTSDNEGARSGASLAYMLIAKFEMWNENWNGAIEALSRLEDIYGDFSQYSYVDNVLFRYKNTPESIFEIQHWYVEGGLQYTSTYASICLPSRSSGAIYAGVEIPELGDNATTWTPWRPTPYFYGQIQKETSGDIRYGWNLMTEYNGQELNGASSAPFPGQKFWCLNLQGSSDGNNYKFFRYADALLMMAECYCELGEYDKSIQYLNYTRNRAGIGDYSFRTAARLTEEIRYERARELIGEFHRKFDLVRWGTWYEETYLHTDSSTKRNNILPCHRYYPIPDDEVELSKYNLDNKEYDLYLGNN